MPRNRHEDIEQFEHNLPGGRPVFITLCACGKAFFDSNSEIAYELWEIHEARF